MEKYSARKQLIIQSAAIKISKVSNNPKSTLEEVDAELEKHEKALIALFGAEEAENILLGLNEGLANNAAMNSIADISGIVTEAVGKEFEARKAKKK